MNFKKMKKRFILKEKQLIEYVENKKDEGVFFNLLENFHNNRKLLNENISYKKVDQTIIDNYRRKNLISPSVYKMLVKNKIMNENYEII
jgi:hypothetical protein